MESQFNLVENFGKLELTFVEGPDEEGKFTGTTVATFHDKNSPIPIRVKELLNKEHKAQAVHQKPKIKIANLYIGEDDHGIVTYEINYADGNTSYMRQSFHKGPVEESEGPSGKQIFFAWDGDRDHVTLTPSYVGEDVNTGAYVHLYLRDNQIELLSDANVELDKKTGIAGMFG